MKSKTIEIMLLMAKGLCQVNHIMNSNIKWLHLVFTNESDMVNVKSSNFNRLPNERRHKALEIAIGSGSLETASESSLYRN